MSDTARLVTVPAAARLAGVNEKTVRRWITSGRPAGITGRCGWLVDADAVMALLAESAVDPTMPDTTPNMPGIPELVELLRDRDQVIREQTQRLEHYAGQLGFYQARIQALEEQVRQLTAPAACPNPPTNRSRAIQWLLRRSSGANR